MHRSLCCNIAVPTKTPPLFAVYRQKYPNFEPLLGDQNNSRIKTHSQLSLTHFFFARPNFNILIIECASHFGLYAKYTSKINVRLYVNEENVCCLSFLTPRDSICKLRAI